MNELATKALFGILRQTLTPVVLWLNSRDILTSDETTQVLLAAATFAIANSTSIWSKVKLLRQRNTALATPSVSTPATLKAAIADGYAAPASVAPYQVPTISTPDLTSTKGL